MSTDTALVAFRGMVARWQLSEDLAAELLGIAPERLQAASDTALGEDAVARIGHLTAISRALNTLFSRPMADRWLTQPNAAAPYNGQWPLDLLIEGGLPAFQQMREALEARM